MLRIDHAVLAVRDLDAASQRLLEEHGLTSLAGGRHPWGTGNRIVPLGSQYVELLAVVDRPVGERTELGRLILEATMDGDRWWAIGVADDDLESTAARLGLAIEGGSRALEGGGELRWRMAGITDPRRAAHLPFLVDWDLEPGLHPGEAPIEHPSGATGIAWVEVTGDADALSVWLGDADLPYRVSPGEPGVVAVAFAAGEGELVLRSDD